MSFSLREIYHRHERWTPVAFFLLGFLFDASVLHRVDELKVILQQALYILISGFLIGIELIEQVREVYPPRPILRIWKYREPLLHFLLGTLLNSFTIFYFKSASGLTSLFYIAVLVTLLILNEFKRFGKSQTLVHCAFLSLCLISYLVELMPVFLRFIGVIPFLCALLASTLIFAGYHRILKAKLPDVPEILKRNVIIPFTATLSGFVLLYFSHVIPPVPLSIKYIGIYHGVNKTPAGYELLWTRPWWEFWEHGDQDFRARPGDPVFCYFQIFSPSGFKDHLQVRWLYHDPKRGWLRSDAIPIPILGGRKNGYRAVTKKLNYQPGEWRVQVETTDGREIGRIGFEISPDQTTGQRTFYREIR